MRNFVIGLATGMFVCAGLFNYVFWQIERRRQGLVFLKLLVAGKTRTHRTEGR